MIYITFKGTEYEIPYKKGTLNINRAIDSTFSNGSFISMPLEGGGGLDFSKRIPRGLKVVYEDDIETFEFITTETDCEKLNYINPKYLHTVKMVSLEKEMTKQPLENITLTQPKGDFGQYSRSVNIMDDNIMYLSNGENIVDFNNTVNSNTSVVDGLDIVSLKEFNILLTGEYWLSRYDIDYDLKVTVKYDTTTIHTQVITVPKAKFNLFGITPSKLIKNINFKYTPTSTGTLSVIYEPDTLPFTGIYDISVHETSLSITAVEIVDKPYRTYAQLVDKILRNTEYVQRADSRSKLNTRANEGKYEELYIYDGLNRIASKLGGLVKTGDLINKRYWQITAVTTEDKVSDNIALENPYDYPLYYVIKTGSKYYRNMLSTDKVREVYFWFNDSSKLHIPIGENSRYQRAEFEDYVSAVELNTKNVLKPIRYSPYRGGWKSLRNIEVGQLTTDNIGYQTEDKIEYTKEVLIKGFPSATATETWTVDDVTDISSRVLEKKQWDTLPSEANYDYSFTGKKEYLKNNTLYYVQGDDKIYGMSYIGETKSRLIGDANVTRSLYETILAVRSLEDDKRAYRDFANQDKDDPATLGNLDGDLAIRMQVKYSNHTESRARVYKDDQTGFEKDYVKYMNESSNVNESESIGSYAQQMVNRLGGTKLFITGVVDSPDELAELGDVDDKGRVYTTIELQFGEKIRYTYMLVQDYNVISSYIGINSRHRVEEISSDSTTTRTLRYTSKFIFTKNEQPFSTRIEQPSRVLNVLTESGQALAYGYLECNLSDGEVKKLHMSVDTDSKGKTIEVKWGMLNNFSAGLKRYLKVIGGQDVWLSTNVPYTDYYGKVNDIMFGVYFDTLGGIDSDIYPEALTSDGDDMFTTITDEIDKDAGEIITGLVEIPILSENPNVRVYDGFAKYNQLVEGSKTISAGVLHYTPMRNSIKVDLSRITDITISGSYTFGALSLTGTSSVTGNGIVFYNKDNLDMLLVVLDDIVIGANELDLWYKVQDSLGGGINYTETFVFNNILATSLEVQTSNVVIDTELKYDYYLDPVDDKYDSVALTYDLQTNLTVQTSNIVIDTQLKYSNEFVRGQDEWHESEHMYKLETALTLTTSNIEVDTQLKYNVDFNKGTDEIYLGEFTYDLLTDLNVQVSNIVIDTQLKYSHLVLKGQDGWYDGNMTYDLQTTLVAQVSNIVIDAELEYQNTLTNITYQWRSGGSFPSGGTVCGIEGYVGNIKCDSETTCEYVADGTYISMTDDSTSPNCGDGTEKIECSYINLAWRCNVYIGTLTTTYSNCQICTEVEVTTWYY